MRLRDPGRYLASMMKRAAIILSVALLVVAASFLVRHVRRRAHADQCRSQLRLVAVWLRGYVTEHGRLPPSVTYDDDGTALQSGPAQYRHESTSTSPSIWTHRNHGLLVKTETSSQTSMIIPFFIALLQMGDAEYRST